MPVTLQDIARDTKVSVVTVSKVLRNQGRISAATRQRVLRRARQLKYQPNWIARSLVMRKTFAIGLLLPDFTHPFFAEIAKAAAEALRPKGYHLVVSYFEEDPEIEKSEVESLVARQVDGLILASAQPPGTVDLFRSLRNRKVPLVLIDRPGDDGKCSFVGSNNEAIGILATSHLVECGCRKIAHLRGPKVGIAAARLTGYRKALKKHGLDYCPKYVVNGSYEDSRGYEAMKQLLKAETMPDGVFCYNDPVAIGAINAIREVGLRVPEDIAVVGAGNVHYSDVLAVPLTTVDQGTQEIGRQAADLLLRQIVGPRLLRPSRILIEPKLVIRESTNRARIQN
jgi:LacI family transcriptional regulator, galactose operon repressor